MAAAQRCKLVTALGLDADARLRPAELEEREEQLRWEAEANRLQRALFVELRLSSAASELVIEWTRLGR